MLSPWLQRWGTTGHARARLFCFPHAGGTAAAFRLWPQDLPQDLEILAAQLPGRGNRWKEPAIASIPGLVEQLLPAMLPLMNVPFAFFGHSMGSMVGYALACELVKRGGPLPTHLFVSARRPPRVTDALAPVHKLPDDQFVAEVNRRYSAIPPEVAREAELMALLLPSLRADLGALETYEAPQVAPLPLGLSAFGGTDDRCTPSFHLEAWREETRGPFRMRLFPGGHFYLDARRAEVLSEVAGTLAPMLVDARTLKA